ncbi:ATP-binding protein [Arachidicoccus ginsenosidivorans]|uniref:ATP-binding protein n=1 Tax=Arachidicoccus ginsenosidivorans TaxID=496057 RepID=A0A5B8VQY1_9BACT|nr:ATP-binding protein [Arachidicoccus ginsenosidivorans]QEC74064.1 ATP-binding protein [Arachidicoccus ginsenosidivorans]
MKQIFLSLGLVVGLFMSCQSQNAHKVTKLWETDAVIKTPESVLPDFENQQLYVSLIEGGGWDADGKGGIGILTMDGKIKNQDFVTGLNAPKGLGRLNQNLYAADMGVVVVISLTNGKVLKTIAIPGGKNLNDITADTNTNTIYVSDSKTGRIWKIINDTPELYLEGVNGANGLKQVGSELFFAKGKALWKAGVDKKQVKIANVPNGIDGIEPVGNGDFIVTAWAGYLYYVTADGKVETLLDTHTEKKNAADIGYDQKNKIIYIPSFNGNTVAAYKLD